MNAGGSALMAMLGGNTWMIVGGSARVGVIAGVAVLGWDSLVEGQCHDGNAGVSARMNPGSSSLMAMLGGNTWMIVGGSARVGVIAGVAVLGWESLVE
jgi:hypothetical protein